MNASVSFEREAHLDALYQLLATDIDASTSSTVEGSRSRTGKLLPAKLGVLKYVLEALESGKIEDCWLCPISLQYDKVIETESYVNELLGNPKEKER